MNEAAVAKSMAARNATIADTPQTEMGYVLNYVENSTSRAKMAMEDLLMKLKPILGDLPPQDVSKTSTLGRTVTSPLGVALMDHANRIEQMAEELNTAYQRVSL